MTIQDLRKLAEAATPEPWCEMDGVNDLWADDDYVFDAQGERRAKKAKDNLRFSAASRNAILPLLDRVEALGKAAARTLDTPFEPDKWRGELRLALDKMGKPL